MHDISSAVLSYLEALSHNELITLLQSFATTHEDIRLAIEEKVAEESTKNKDVAAVEYNLQIMAQTMPESVTADVYHPSHILVTWNSTAREKINLYTSLFVGRKDVFALRWYNAKSNKSGYSPVCENKWKIGKCDMKKYSCAGIF